MVPNSDFTVKRTAYKDNSSDYHINDRKVQYKEVGQLLRDCGVDLDHNRFLILQGKEQYTLIYTVFCVYTVKTKFIQCFWLFGDIKSRLGS